MTVLEKGDLLVEFAADRLQSTADRFAAEGGAKAKLAETLADDAAFLRQLKPTLIRARMKGEASTDGAPAHGTVRRTGMMSFGDKPPKASGSGGPNPVVVVGAALAVGIFLAKVIDWRSHAHPRL